MSQLLLYKASAGSGKTFELVFQYLLKSFEDPGNFRSILAVTFTNKAADEMKGRIFHELHKLHTSPESSKYLQLLVRSLGRSEEWISNQAGKIKTMMLHDYSRISVETIDHFFQGILKSFARESGLSSGYQLELDTAKVLDQFVAYVFDEVRKDRTMRKWMIEWVTERMEEGEKWHKMEADLVDTGFELLKEEVLGLLLQPDAGGLVAGQIGELQNTARRIIQQFRTDLEAISGESIRFFDQHGLNPSDFYYGSTGPAGYLATINPDKPPGARATEAVDNPSKWVKKGSPNERQIMDVAYEPLNAQLKKAVHLFQEKGKDYKTAQAVNRNLFALWFSSSLLKFLRENTRKSNEILLTLTQPLIQLIIKENPSPFIYEKTGTYLKHFLIDEFQDTSDLQWKNFLPLLENTLSEDGLGLVVGDVKQSLYRWRNSNWKLIHKKAASDLAAFGIHTRDLAENHRSADAIIKFNNALFPIIPKFLLDKLRDDFGAYSEQHESEMSALQEVYKDAVQNPGINSGKPGYVEIQVIDDTKSETGWRDQIAERLPLMVEELIQNRGYRQKDILFLVRNNREAGVIAGILDDYRSLNPTQHNKKWTFVSADVFRIEASEIVGILLSVFSYLATRERYYLQLLDFQLKSFKDPEHFPDPDAGGTSADELRKILDELTGKDPLSVMDEVLALLDIEPSAGDLPYLFQFRDLVRNFREKGSGHIEGFLEWWEMTGSKSMLVTEGIGDAMQIMTIHRAKGLSSPVVIIPFCNWSTDHSNRKRPWLWAETKDTPFSLVPRIPVRYASSLKDSWFGKFYRSERLEAAMDNLNLLYVAFTRAEEVLIAMCPLVKGQTTVANAVAASLPETPVNGIMRSGAPDVKRMETKEKVTSDLIAYEAFVPFTASSEVKLDLTETDEPRRFGRLVHKIMETIKTVGDIDPVLSGMVRKRECDPKEEGRIRNTVTELFSIPEVVDWFTGSWEVMNEPVICVPGSGERRPDRFMSRGDEAVVVDYKTGAFEAKHKDQVNGYMQLIRQMDYPEVRGYLLYLDPPALIEVKGREDYVQPSLFGQEV